MNRRTALGFLAGISSFLANPLSASDFKEGIKIGFLPITDHLPIIASKLDEKSMIVPIKFSNWADIAEALRAGAIDGAFLLAPLGLNLRASGVKIKAVLSGHKNGSSLVVNKSINSLEELEGKKIAVPSRFSIHYFLLSKLLKEKNITAKIIDMAPPEMPFALFGSQIDGFIVAEPFGQIAVKRGAKNLLFSKDIKPNHICCVLNVSEELTRNSSFNAFLEHFKNSANYIRQNHQAASKLGSQILAQKAEVLKDVLDKNIISFDDLSLKESDLEELREFLVENKLGTDKLATLNLKDYLL